MKIMSLSSLPMTLIDKFNSQNSFSSSLIQGQGEQHIYYLNFDKDSIIGPHIAGFGQLFVILSGTGWVAGEDDCPQFICPGQVAFISKGERHSKGSKLGMTVMMIQVEFLEAGLLIDT